MKIGTERQLISEATSAAGTTSCSFHPDTAMGGILSLSIASITSGSLYVKVTAITPDGSELIVAQTDTHTDTSGSPHFLVVRQIQTDSIRVDAVYTGACSYTVGFRASSVPLESRTRDLTGNVIPFSNATYGFDMNQNGAASGTPDKIHNGTDTSLWTGSNLTNANFVFNSTTQAHAGTHSVADIASVNGDRALFTRSSPVASSSYVSLTGWIYITAWSTKDTPNVSLQFRLAGVNSGSNIGLAQYIQTGTFNSWQKFTIQLSTFGVSGNIDQLVCTVTGSPPGSPPHFYLDDIQLEQSGAGITYSVVPNSNTLFHVYNLTIFAAATKDGRLASSSMPNVTWNQFMGLSRLGAGMIATTTLNGNFTFAGSFQTHADLSMLPATRFTSGSDGTTTWYRYDTKFDQSILLDSRTGDNMTFIINDDLSGLLFFRIFSNGVSENISYGELL